MALPLDLPAPAPKLWMPKRVLVTKSALGWEHGQRMVARMRGLGLAVSELNGDRLTGLNNDDPRRAYIDAKNTLAVVVAPPGKMRLQPIPPSADWRVDLAEGCPAHCQYCYLAGSLGGPPVTRAYANLPDILGNLRAYLGKGNVTSKAGERQAEGTTFEASCYTDPLGIEHLTGSLSEFIRFFGAWEEAVQLRFTTKFDDVGPLLGLPHRRRTRVRFSVNAAPLARKFEGGTAPLPARLDAMRRMALAGYPVGLTIAPIMPMEGWEEAYGALLDDVAARLAPVPGLDLSVELITHRFTPGSKEVLTGWYPASKLEMDEEQRARKMTKFRSVKYVYLPAQMKRMKVWFEDAVPRALPGARILYWT
ncbi:radical SAM protein [Aerophototrophica crusticola]|uniref:Radical SAM protein n=1 Tax=Aerophototrophica crusticola TaxID=1709002 RepID=A0A858R7Y8_9PROT|nr:radical SAM protein [Rhodospirillaceae bacterium B3]